MADRGTKPDSSEPRFYVGALGLFYVSTMLMLSLWAVLPSLAWGWSPFVITSGSMEPTIQAGDIIVASTPRPELGRGTVVVFDDPASGGLVTHRIWSARDTGEYITKGDANQQPDSSPITDSNIRGVGRLLVPLIGKPGLWMRTNFGIFAAWALLTGGAFYASRWALYQKYDPWTGAGLPRTGRHRQPKVYIGRHLRPPRHRLAAQATKAVTVTLLIMATAGYAHTRAAWADQTDNPQNTFASGAYGPLATVDLVATLTASATEIYVGETTTLTLAITNNGDAETTGIITSTSLLESVPVTVAAGETAFIDVSWQGVTAGVSDIALTVTTDEVIKNDLATIQIAVLP